MIRNVCGENERWKTTRRLASGELDIQAKMHKEKMEPQVALSGLPNADRTRRDEARKSRPAVVWPNRDSDHVTTYGTRTARPVAALASGRSRAARIRFGYK